MSTTQQRPTSERSGIWISQPEGQSNCYSDPEHRFAIVAEGYRDIFSYLHKDAYSLAMAFMEGEIDVRGDIFAASRHVLDQAHPAFRQFLFSKLAAIEHIRARFHSAKTDAKKNIHYHYDLSNEFYAQFLDSRMVYSAAYFEDPSDSLEKAQTQKLDRICRDLVLRREERFLDVGCGWGGLICFAAERFGSRAFGCTLSRQQLEFAQRAIDRQHLVDRASVNFCDYRELDGEFDKVASVGMFEHVGRTRLATYFENVYSLLKPGGLFLNRGLIRPRGMSDGPETLFIQKQVFPGGELVHLDNVVRAGESAGFDVAGVRDLRMHYALTCRRWVQNLQANAAHCQALVGNRQYRTWLLYLAGSAVSLEDRRIGAVQVLFAKPREGHKQ